MSLDKETTYKTAFEAWKFQVDQYWTRSSYYVVFELAFAAGIWKVFDAGHWWTSAFMSVGATVFTVLWILNNERLNEYIGYYWKRLSEIEKELGIEENLRIFSVLFAKIERKRYPGNYRQYARALPPVFFAGWLWMFAWSILSIQAHCDCIHIK
jgi:hypothetical protein